ncbi:MAG: glycosyltransferase family 4 protein [Thermoflexales bacterium]|nr:glycosyltransferase family 4 protein [Thermoflexales bacterium]
MKVDCLSLSQKLKIAYISPLNPLQSGISDYSEALLPSLAEYFHVTLYSDCGTPYNHEIVRRFQVYPVLDLCHHHFQYDLRLYQLGNSPHHRNAFAVIRSLPGIVVLHEPFLHHGLYYSSPIQYIREYFYEIGAPDWLSLNRLVQALQSDDRQQLLENPLIGRIVETSLGILVHSRAALTIVERCFSQSRLYRRALPKVKIIPQPINIPDAYEIAKCRKEFELPSSAVIFGMAGFIHPIKEPHLALQAFARVQKDFPDALFLFIGEVLQETGDLITQARELGIAEKMVILGRMEPLERLHQALAACDVVLNLRRTTIGETSAIALRAMALGKPVIVRDIGWFSELPNDVCVKIGSEDGVEQLASVMRTLAISPEMRFRIGQNAKCYIQSECNPSRVAHQYAEFLWDVYLSIVNAGMRGVG